MLKLIAFDFGHTLVHERAGADIPLERRPIHLMPDVADTLAAITLPMAVWANTRVEGQDYVRRWLSRAGIDDYFSHIVTSAEAGVRKPARGFFEFALAQCGVSPGDVLFVGNQRNTDIRGGVDVGIRTVWLSGSEYHSEDDDSPVDVTPTFTITRLNELPSLLQSVGW